MHSKQSLHFRQISYRIQRCPSSPSSRNQSHQILCTTPALCSGHNCNPANHANLADGRSSQASLSRPCIPSNQCSASFWRDKAMLGKKRAKAQSTMGIDPCHSIHNDQHMSLERSQALDGCSPQCTRKSQATVGNRERLYSHRLARDCRNNNRCSRKFSFRTSQGGSMGTERALLWNCSNPILRPLARNGSHRRT